MSIDRAIKSRNRGNSGRGQARLYRGRNLGRSFRGGGFAGQPRNYPLGVNTHPYAYVISKCPRRNKDLPWQRDQFQDGVRASGLLELENKTNLFVSNLDVGVSNDDIRELFSKIGELKRYALHYDKNGCPSGSAEVVFARSSDAFLAVKRYNNVQLDGRPMKVEVLSANLEIPISTRVNVVGGSAGRKRTVVISQMSHGNLRYGWGRGRRRGGWSQSNGHGRGRHWDFGL